MLEKNNQPLVSVVIPCYNHEQFVQDSIQSVIDQSYQNIELIIIDDGSKDGSVEMIEHMIPACEKRFSRFEFRNRPNKGLTGTLNEALKWIEGVYCIFIASDDIMINTRLKKQVLFLENNKKYYACSGGQIKINDQNEILPQKNQNMLIKSFCEKNRDNIFKTSNNIYSPTTMFRTKTIHDLGGYHEEILIEDLYIFYRAALRGLVHAQVPECFAYYRMHDNNNHSRFMWMHENKLKILLEIERKEECKPLRKLIYLEGFYSISKYVGRKEALPLLKHCIKYFYHPYFVVGFVNLLIRW